MTNGDEIRAMSDEELANFLEERISYCCSDCHAEKFDEVQEAAMSLTKYKRHCNPHNKIAVTQEGEYSKKVIAIFDSMGDDEFLNLLNISGFGNVCKPIAKDGKAITQFRLSKKENKNFFILQKLECMGARETKATTRSIYYEANGNHLPFLL